MMPVQEILALTIVGISTTIMVLRLGWKKKKKSDAASGSGSGSGSDCGSCTSHPKTPPSPKS